jgi:predicted nuclease of predicted toxin-antitoxin system
MRILLDECIPRKLRTRMSGHECRTVHEEGWAGRKNGELLQAADSAGFQVFLTLDRGIEFEQNLQQRKITIVLIKTKSNRLADLLPHVGEILKVLSSIGPSQIAKVG